MSIDPDNYIEITSYTHHPFYEKILLEIPDNWSNDLYYNVPVNDLKQIIDYALEKGYSICWDGDVSDKGFSHKNGVAIIPEINPEDLSDTEQARWEDLSEKEKEEELYKFEKPVGEKTIDQEIRQHHFDNWQATDDHLMHITGMVEDQNGTKYYITKNSWSEESNDFGGYLNMSESYIMLNTIAIMIHKDALPEDIARKLGF
jgi:bleomycin hydrolase